MLNNEFFFSRFSGIIFLFFFMRGFWKQDMHFILLIQKEDCSLIVKFVSTAIEPVHIYQTFHRLDFSLEQAIPMISKIVPSR